MELTFNDFNVFEPGTFGFSAWQDRMNCYLLLCAAAKVKTTMIGGLIFGTFNFRRSEYFYFDEFEAEGDDCYEGEGAPQNVYEALDRLEDLPDNYVLLLDVHDENGNQWFVKYERDENGKIKTSEYNV